MLKKIKNFFRSRTVYKETGMQVISFFVEKTYPVFSGTFSKKTNKETSFVVGKTKYGPVKIPISEKVYAILQKKSLANRNKIPFDISVRLKIQEIKKKNHKEAKILAGMVILHEKKL